MLPTSLRLRSFRHCYVHLPDEFIQRETKLRPGSIVGIQSVQNDAKILVSWNGNSSSSPSCIELDLTFAKANGINEEIVVLDMVNQQDVVECSSCIVELVQSSDYTILSEHKEANLLESCRIIYPGLFITIYLSQNVNVVVKVREFRPEGKIGVLTNSTAMHFLHESTVHHTSGDQVDMEAEDTSEIVDEIPFLSCSLGKIYTPMFHLGSMLVCGEKGSGKTHFLKTVLNNYRRYKGILFNCQELRGKRPENVKKKFTELLDECFANQPSILALDDIDSILKADPRDEGEKGPDAIYRKRLVSIFCQMLKKLERTRNGRVVIIATCQSYEQMDERISKCKGRKYFSEIVKLEFPKAVRRFEILKSMILDQKQINSDLSDEQIEDIAKQCTSYMPFDLRILVERSVIASCSRSSLNFSSDPPTLSFEDFQGSIEKFVPYNLRQVSLQPKTLRSFKDVGGMRDIIAELKKTVVLQVKYPKLYSKCPLKPQNSILLYGPPGCGKTLIAEALTNEECINSICVRGPELLKKYIGASEAAVRDLFRQAELARPCVIFFDEFESLVSCRGSDSTGTTDRIVNQFLTLLDGVEQLSNDVFLIAASSRPDLIDPAMLRPGRLDKHIYCPMPDSETRLDILKVLSEHMTFADKSDSCLRDWAQKLEGFSGADIYSLLYSANQKAWQEIFGPMDYSTGKLIKEPQKNKGEIELIVKQSHMERSFEEMKFDVADRLASILEKYPRQIGKRSRVATRATLQ